MKDCCSINFSLKNGKSVCCLAMDGRHLKSLSDKPKINTPPLGMFGTLIYSASFYFMIQQLFDARKLERIDRNYFLFALIGLALMFIDGLFGQPFSDFKGVFLLGLLGGICYQSKFLCSVAVERTGGLP